MYFWNVLTKAVQKWARIWYKLAETKMDWFGIKLLVCRTVTKLKESAILPIII